MMMIRTPITRTPPHPRVISDPTNTISGSMTNKTTMSRVGEFSHGSRHFFK